jgi:2-oxoglutarate ferredoxin oxidoreductase subunit beta
MKTSIQVEGVFETPINPLSLAISLDASFVARGSAGEPEKTKEIIKQAINHKGFALVDVFQACVTFNKINTHKWFKENTYFLEDTHDPKDRLSAMKRSMEQGPWPLGIFYINDKKTVFEDKLAPYENGDMTPLYLRDVKPGLVRELLEEKM